MRPRDRGWRGGDWRGATRRATTRVARRRREALLWRMSPLGPQGSLLLKILLRPLFVRRAAYPRGGMAATNFVGTLFCAGAKGGTPRGQAATEPRGRGSSFCAGASVAR